MSYEQASIERHHGGLFATMPTAGIDVTETAGEGESPDRLLWYLAPFWAVWLMAAGAIVYFVIGI